jgi:hypothetical protein
MHLYGYKECSKPIKATAEFVPAGASQPVTYDVAIPPGNQTMLCATDKPSVSCQAVSDDGALHREKREFTLTDGEYTHVLTCKCVGEDCPDPWPDPTTRQPPVEECGGE